jgi:hypothetical protein
MFVSPTREANIERLNVLRDWPGGESSYIPSKISYASSPRSRWQWGHDIEDGSDVMRYFDLDLESRSRLSQLQGLRQVAQGLRSMAAFHADRATQPRYCDIPLHIGLDAEDVVADFLRKVVRFWFDRLSADYHLLDFFACDIVISHPPVSRILENSSLEGLYTYIQ